MNIMKYEEVGSTNLLAEEFAALHPNEEALFIANRQTAGRGRLDRSFSSEEGGLYMSILLPVSEQMSDTVGFTAFCGVKAAEVIERFTGLEIGIKWVNDLVLKGRKLGGIMTRGIVSPDTNRITHLIVGIGINIRNTLPEELKDIAISLGEVVDDTPDPAVLAWNIARSVSYQKDNYLSPAVLEAYRSRLTVLGREVTVYTPDGSYPAAVLAVNEDYSLTVRPLASEGADQPGTAPLSEMGKSEERGNTAKDKAAAKGWLGLFCRRRAKRDPKGTLRLYTGEISIRDSASPHKNPFE